MWWFLRDPRNPISTGLENMRPKWLGEASDPWRGRDRPLLAWREREARTVPVHGWSHPATPRRPGRLESKDPSTICCQTDYRQ